MYTEFYLFSKTRVFQRSIPSQQINRPDCYSDEITLQSRPQYLTTHFPNHSPIMRIQAVSAGENPPFDINVIIEVPIGGEPIKYELDKAAGALVVDRFLYTPMRYPGNYGFVPHTLSEDGDPIDVLVCNTRAIFPGAVMNCRPIGVLVMEDDGGEDEKIIAVPSAKISQRYSGISNYDELPQITLDQIQHFFEHYKDLEPGKWVKIQHWGDAQEAQHFIETAMERTVKA